MVTYMSTRWAVKGFAGCLSASTFFVEAASALLDSGRPSQLCRALE